MKAQTTNSTEQMSDKNKLEKLTKYFNQALEQYVHGNPKQLNEIFDDMLNEKTDLEYVKLWLKTFTRKLLETSRDKKIQPDTAESASSTNQSSLLINFILYRSKWLQANSKHLAVFSLYESFCMTLLSVCNLYLPVILKILFQNFVPRNIFENPESLHDAEIKICNNTFKTRKDLIGYVGNILRGTKLKTNSPEEFLEVSSEHQKFLLELFKYHPKSNRKLLNASKVLVGVNTLGKNKFSKCFYISKGPSEKEDISYLKACDSAADAFDTDKMNSLLSENELKLIDMQMNMLLKLQNIYPLAKKQFQSVISDCFPHRRLDESIQRIFFINILKFGIKCPKLNEHIVKLCFEKIIMIDAEIKHETRGGGTEPTKVASDSLEMAHKIDWLLVTLFDYVEFIFKVKRPASFLTNSFGEVDSSSRTITEEENDKATDRFLEFLDIFELYLLITFESKYVQFIMFYLCSFTDIYPSFVELFLSTLIRIIKDEDKNTVIRINSAKYLCSFLSRAKFVPFNVVNDTVGFIMEYVEEFMTRNKDRKLKRTQNPLTVYEIFHYTVQALTLIFWGRFDYFVENRSLDHANRFVDTCDSIQKYFHSFDYMSFKTLKLFETFLDKFRPGCELASKIHEIAIANGETSTPEKQLEDKYPFDPHFLKHSSKYLVKNYVFYENYDADVFLRGYVKTPQSFMNYSENNLEAIENSREIDSCSREDEKSSYDSLSIVSKHGTETSETDNRAATVDRFLDVIKPKPSLFEGKKKRDFQIEHEEPAVGKKVDTSKRQTNLTKNTMLS